MRTEHINEVDNYRKTLIDLKNEQNRLGLKNDPPKESVTIVPGTQSSGRPLGAKLPVYPNNECGIDEEGMGKTLFNLKSLLNFTPSNK